LFSGPGILGNEFNPALAGLGSHTIVYEVEVGGCPVRDTVLLIVGSGQVPSIQPVDASCPGAPPSQLVGTPAGGSFSGPGVTGSQFEPDLAGVGTHIITYSGTERCGPFSTSISIRVNPGADTARITPVAPLCESDAPITLQATPSGGTFVGDGVQGNVFNPRRFAPGTYTIRYTGSNVCGPFADSILVTILAPTAPILEALAPLCPDSVFIPLEAVPSGGTWSGPGIKDSTFNPTGLAAGDYTLIYEVQTDCGPAIDSILVTVLGADTAMFPPIGPFTIGDSPIQLQATPEGGTFGGPGVDGNTGTFSPAIAGVGLHQLVYAGQNACGEFRDSIVVQVEGLIPTIPNVFTPNGDGFNDRLTVEGVQPIRISWVIYDRWGIKVHTSNDLRGWDGTRNGNPCTEGVYVYSVELTLPDGFEWRKIGTVTLLR
jgi:gliding motility-associated-like protein